MSPVVLIPHYYCGEKGSERRRQGNLTMCSQKAMSIIEVAFLLLLSDI